MYLPVRTIIALLFFVAIILLQIFLCKRKNKWLGLIIPIISFVFSILWILGIPYYLSMSALTLKIIIVFIIANIPTAIFLTIYFIVRNNTKKMGLIK
ncbi:MAG: hypothetical protein FH751_09790 [Firmicutes bacterium]|nr:hypothetical protein [Bacillota bacterium]